MPVGLGASLNGQSLRLVEYVEILILMENHRAKQVALLFGERTGFVR